MAGTSFDLIHRTTYLKVDVFPCNSAFNRSALLRAVTIEVPGANKRSAFRVSKTSCSPSCEGIDGAVNRQQCNSEIRQLIELNRDELYLAYLRQWGAVLGVDALLTGALA